MTARPRGRRPRPVRVPTDASRKLVAARLAGRITIALVAKQMNVNWRTIKRWETGETRPNAEEWSKLTVVLAHFAPQAAIDLAHVAGVPSPIAPPPAPPPPPVVDTRAIEDALVYAADRLDLAPGRVRAVVRDLVVAVTKAHGTIDDLGRAAQERVRNDPSGGGTA